MSTVTPILDLLVALLFSYSSTFGLESATFHLPLLILSEAQRLLNNYTRRAPRVVHPSYLHTETLLNRL